jgi:hypothetical protein
MKLEDVSNIAKSRGVRPGKLSKTELIESLLAQEGCLKRFAAAKRSQAVLGVTTVSTPR